MKFLFTTTLHADLSFLAEGKNDLKILSYCYNDKRTVKDIATYVEVTPSTFFRSKVIGSGILNSKSEVKQGQKSMFFVDFCFFVFF